jgi:hypothetical protein
VSDPYDSKLLSLVAVLLVVVPLLLIAAFVVLARTAVLMAGGWSFWRSFGIALAIVVGVAAWGLLARRVLRWSREP